MGTLDFIDKQQLDLGTEIAQQPSTDFFDVVSASFESTTDNYIVGAGSRLNANFTSDRDKKYKSLTGRDIYNDALRFIDDKESVYNPRTGTLNKDSQQMREAVDKLIVEGRNNNIFGEEVVDTYLEINEKSKDKARASLDAYNKTSQGASETASTAGGLVGGLGASFIDPLNIATLPFGAGVSRGVLKTIFLEAGLNAGIEAASQPFVAQWQNEIGNEYGFTEAAENVAIAALFGGSIGGLTKGAQKSYAHFFSETSVKLKELGETEGALSAQVMERKAHLDQSDLTRITDDEIDINYKRHEDSMIEANDAILNERKINPENIKIADDEIMAIKPDKVEPAMRSTVERFQEPEQLPLPMQEKQLDQAEVHDVFEFNNEPIEANLKAQEELENLYNSQETVQRELEAFEEIEPIKVNDTEVKILGDTDADDLTINEINESIKADKEYIEALRVCGM